MGRCTTRGYTIDVLPICLIIHVRPSGSIRADAESFLMTPKTHTLAGVLDSLASTSTSDLAPQVQRHWLCSVGRMAKAFGRRPEELPASWRELRGFVEGMHHVELGWTRKTASNHKSNLKAALCWYEKR